MSVKKSVLKQKSNLQLEEYIKPESRFIPEASKFAFEILKSRGRNFSEEEMEQINSLIEKKEEKKEIVIHENNIKASNLMFLSAVLGLINFSLSDEITIKNGISATIMSLSFLIFLALLIRRGYNGVKYILTALFILGLVFYIPYLGYDLQNFPLNGIISICQSIAQISAVVLLFLIPKEAPILK
jgi:hypothetical protein